MTIRTKTSTINLTVLLILCLSLPGFSEKTKEKKSINGSVQGNVIDSRTNKKIEGALIEIIELTKTEVSDSLGNFTFSTLPPDLYSLQVTKNGYDTSIIPNIHIKSGNNNTLKIELKKSIKIQELSKMKITSNRLDRKKTNQSTSVSIVSNFELNNTAGTVNDVNRVIGTLPSAVIGIGEGFDNNIYVRGGNSAENIFIVDGIELENISHFSAVDESGGAIGFLNPSLIQNLEFYAGGIPVNMPPRISSVTDIHIRDGSFSDRKYYIDLNASGLGFTLEGPLFKNKMSYLVNSRIVYLKFLKSFLDEIEGIPFYGDSHIKLTFKPSQADKFALNFLFSFDNYKEDGYRWLTNNSDWIKESTDYTQNLFLYATGLNWEHNFNKINARNLFHISGVKRDYIDKEDFISYKPESHKTQPPQHYNNKKAIADSGLLEGLFITRRWFDSKNIYEESDKRENATLKNDFSFFLRDKDQINIGFTGKYLRYKMRNKNTYSSEGLYLSYEIDSINDSIIIHDTLDTYAYNSFDRDSLKTGYEVGGYIQYVFEQNWLKIIAGVRGDYYSIFRDQAISPRGALRVNAGKIGAFALSGGIYYQARSELSSILFDYLVPNPNYDLRSLKLYEIELQRNKQVVFGYEKYFKDIFHLSTEVYYKLYDREYAYKYPENPDYVSNPDDTKTNWIHLNDPKGKKEVYGLEIMFQKKKYDKFYYSFAYSLFFAKNKYTNGKYYNDKNSMRNTLSCIVGTNFRKHHGLALRFSAMEGRPYCKEILIGDENEKKSVIDTTKTYYSKRFDPMFSLNLRYTFKIYKKWGNLMGYIDILNVLNLSPTVDRFFHSGRQIYMDDKVNGIMPVAGITLDW